MNECVFLCHPQPRDTGDYLHRTLWPGEALGRHMRTVAVQTSHPEALRMAQESRVLVIKMIADEVMLDLVRWRNARGRVTVYEISDDFEAFPPHVPSHAFYASPEVQALIRQLAGEASAVQFSSPALAKKYAALNRRNATFLNQCRDLPALPPRNESARPLVIGWAGSSGHQDEVAQLIEWLKAWRARHPRQDIVLAVMANPEISTLFTQAGLAPRLTPVGTMADYLDFISGLDVGLAVLGEDDFSLGRSDGKFLEYASRGVVAVCSDRGSYHATVEDGVTGLLFGDREQFCTALDRALESETWSRLRRNAYEYLRRERTHEADALNRFEFYRSLCSDSDGSWTQQAQGFVDAVDPLEAPLYDAMAKHAAGELQAAMQGYMAAMEGSPGFYLPWLQLAQLMRQLGSSSDAELCEQTARELLQKIFGAD